MNLTLFVGPPGSGKSTHAAKLPGEYINQDLQGKSDKSDKNNFVVDHNHATGEIRAILCSYCNRALGMFKDNVDILNKAMLYLKSNGKGKF